MTGALALAAGVMPAASAAAGTAAAAASSAPKFTNGTVPVRSMHKVGTVSMRHLVAQAANLAKQRQAASKGRRNAPLRKLPRAGHASPAAMPGTAPQASSTSVRGISNHNVSHEHGFVGISGPLSRAVNLYDVSPPDQGLGVGPWHHGKAAVEFVNLALNVYTTRGKSLAGAIPAWLLFGQQADATLSDPRVMYDPHSGHWFITMFTYGDGVTAPLSRQFVAVSSGRNLYYSNLTIFSFDTSDSSNASGGCPCLGDFDMIGADRYGFYITTNEFSVDGPNFNGTIIYSMSKKQLASFAHGGAAPLVHTLAITADSFGAYHWSPSSVPQGAYTPGTEYFVESNGLLPYDNHTSGRGLKVLAFLHTARLDSNLAPIPAFRGISTEYYSQPPVAHQKYGGSTRLQTDFNAVQEVTFVRGRLYAELSTGFSYRGHRRSGVAWFVMKPRVSGTAITRLRMIRNGYVKTRQFLLYPDIGVDKYGHGFITFAVSGPSYYPSAGYIKFKGSRGVWGKVRIAAKGSGQLQDFTCYLGIGGCRYGDYSMAQAYNGRIYMATEYVAPIPADLYTNWATRVWSAPAPS